MISGIEKYFKSGYKIHGYTMIQNDFGEWVEDWTLKGELDGLMRNLRGDERFTADKETYFGDNRFYCFPQSFDIESGDEIEDPDGNKYDIKNPNNVMGFDKLMQIDCELRK